MPRGFKICPNCQKQVGPRTRVCECDYEFAFKQGKAPKRPRKALRLPADKEPFASLSENPSEVVGIDDRDALASLIEQLQACQADSNRTGGCYSAFAHCKGGHTVQIEVWLPLRVH